MGKARSPLEVLNFGVIVLFSDRHYSEDLRFLGEIGGLARWGDRWMIKSLASIFRQAVFSPSRYGMGKRKGDRYNFP